MVYPTLFKRLRKEIAKYSNIQLEHALKCYNRIVVRNEKTVRYALRSLNMVKMERKIILQEIEKRAEKSD